MMPKSLREIYLQLSRATCFRVRHVDTLADWVVGCVYDWTWEDTREGRLPIAVKAAALEFGERDNEFINANHRHFALLSSTRELEWLKTLPPTSALFMARESYKMAAQRDNLFTSSMVDRARLVEQSLSKKYSEDNRVHEMQRSYMKMLTRNAHEHAGDDYWKKNVKIMPDCVP